MSKTPFEQALPDSIELTVEQQTIIDNDANALRKKMETEGWRIVRDRAQKIGPSLQNILITGYRELMDSIVTAGQTTETDQDQDIAQIGIAEKLRGYVNMSPDIKKLIMNKSDKEKVVLKLTGSIIRHAILTSRKLGVPVDFDPKVFGLTEEYIKRL